MKSLYKIITICLFLQTSMALAQETTNYTLISNKVSVSEKPVVIKSILDKTENSFLWEQQFKGKSIKNKYAIKSTEGNWDTSTSTGSLTHYLSREGISATLKVDGSQKGITAVLSIQNGHGSELDYNFKIIKITYD